MTSWTRDPPAKLLQVDLGLVGCRPAELVVLVGFDHRQQPFAAFQGLLGLDLGAEPGP
jgi:hypothetical protein